MTAPRAVADNVTRIVRKPGLDLARLPRRPSGPCAAGMELEARRLAEATPQLFDEGDTDGSAR